MRILVFSVLLVACHSTPKSAAKPIVDTGFSMQQDAFAFANFGDSRDGSKLTAVEVVRLFGPANVCVSGTSPCTLSGAAQNWLTQANTFLASGRCEGFNILSQLLFNKTLAASSFGGTTTHALVLADNAALQRELAYWSSTQLLAATSDDNMQKLSAKDALTYLQSALADTSKVYRIGLVYIDNGVQAGAHSVTPIGIDRGATATTFSLRVYDSNVPDTAQTIAIDTAANEWSYSSTDANGAALSGDVKNPLYVFTSAPHLGTYECPFCGNANDFIIATQGVHITYADFPDATVTQAPVFTQSVPTGGGMNPGLYVQVLDGVIHLTNGGGSQSFSAGQFGFTPSFQQPPVILPTNPGIQFTPPPAFSAGSASMNGGSMSAKPGAVDCIVRDDAIPAQTACGKAPAKKLYCNRDVGDTTPSSGPTSMSQTITAADGRTITQTITVESATTLLIGTALQQPTARDDKSSVTSCATTTAPTPTTVTVSTTTPASDAIPATVQTFSGTVTLDGDANVTPDPTQWLGPGQPMPIAVTQNGTTTPTYVADTQTPDTTAPTAGTALTLTPAHTSVQVAWGAAVDPDNMAIPAPSLRYKVVRAQNTGDLATLALADAISGAGVVMDYTADATSVTATGLAAGTQYVFAVIVEDLAGNKALYAPVSTRTTAKLIFVTAQPVPGDVGITGADSACASDSGNPGGATFKAMLVDNSTRRACTTAYCTGGVSEQLDWVLSPDTTYANTAPVAAILTNARGLLVEPLADILGTQDYSCWTGLAIDWTTSADDCGGWTSVEGMGAFGSEHYTSHSAWSDGSQSCDSNYRLYCIEQ